MADEPHYSNKRKASDGSPPLYAARRPTGFSAAPPDPAAASSLPADEIEMAKQRAQEIAARLFSSAEAKRPRSDTNGDSDHGPVKGFGSSPPDLAQKYPVQYNNSQGGLASSYGGYHGSSKMIDVPNGRVGVIIGRGGETIKYLQNQSGAKIQVTRDIDSDRHALTRAVELTGTPDQISRAEELIHEVLAEADAGGSGSGTGRSRLTPVQAGSDQLVLRVPNNKVGLVIGKGGESIKNMQASTGARIQVIPLHLPPGDTSMERTVQIDGTKEQIDAAKQMIDEVCSENRGRNPSMGGGYSQQGYRPLRPPTSWGHPGMPPMQQQQQQQQPGYGYMQPGAYPGPPPQYSTSQSAHGGYPPQAASGWDQSNPSNQQNAPSAGYDYYNQQTSQQQQTASGSSAQADNASYNYGQPATSAYNVQGSYGETNYGNPPSGQHGYGQDGYGGYHAPSSQVGYGPPSSQPTYDQSQGYGSAPNLNQESSAPSHGAQGAIASQPPSQQGPPPAPSSSGTQTGGQAAQPPNGTPPYGSQGANQAGYGMPPTSQPGYGSHPPQAGYSHTGQVAYPGYGQYPTGQKLSSQQGYHQGLAGDNASSYPPQAPPSQSGYGQPDPATHNGSSSYTTTAPPPSYGSNQPDPATTHGSSGYSANAPPPSYGSHQAYGTQPPSQAAYSGGQQQQPSYADSYGSGGYPQHPAYSGDNASGGSAHGSYEGGQSAKSGMAKASPKA